MSAAADDLALLAQWRSGDATAGQALFRRHFDSVYRFFETKCADEADELVQATFLACLRSRDRFRGDSSFRTYLFAIARHELYRALEKRIRNRERMDFAVSSIVDLITTPATRMARSQEHRHLIEALQRLPVEQQTLLELYYWQELPMSELAIVLEATEETVRQRLHRARKALRERLATTAPPHQVETEEAMDRWVKTFAAS